MTQLDEWVECESYRDQRVSDVIARNTAKKLYNKEYRDNKSNARSHVYQSGDQVLLRYQRRADKMTPFYEAAPYEVVDVNGSAILLQGEDGKVKMRNAVHMKGFNTVPDQLRYQPLPAQQQVAEGPHGSSIGPESLPMAGDAPLGLPGGQAPDIPMAPDILVAPDIPVAPEVPVNKPPDTVSPEAVTECPQHARKSPVWLDSYELYFVK